MLTLLSHLIWHLILPITWSTFISLQYEWHNHKKGVCGGERTLKVFQITVGFHITAPRVFFSMSQWSVRNHKTHPKVYPLPLLPWLHQTTAHPRLLAQLQQCWIRWSSESLVGFGYVHVWWAKREPQCLLTLLYEIFRSMFVYFRVFQL